MSATWDGPLLEPLSADAPCGKNLEDTDKLSVLDMYQIFGQTSLEPPKREPGDPVPKEARKSDRPPNWAEIRDEALSSLGVSKDLRVLTHFAAAVLRTEGIPAFARTLGVASHWLAVYPTQVYPLIDEDALFRQNALNCFADPVAIVDGLRRTPIVSHRQHGRFSLRDLEISSGQTTPVGDEPPPDAGRIDEAFKATDLNELKAVVDSIEGALTALSAMDSAMRTASNGEFVPTFDPLSSQFKKMVAAVKARIAVHPAATAADAGEVAPGEGGAAAPGLVAVGAIKSRQDAIRALEAAAEFFRRNEPSSPIPLFLDRAKRLVSKDFLEVLADVAPDALPQARTAGGLRDES
jgi:type VI secretion system protein ImpA